MGIISNLRKDCWHFDTSDVDYNDTPMNLIGINAVQGKDSLTSTQRACLDKLVLRYFDLMGDKLVCTDLVEHHIETTATPIKQRYYRISPAVQEKINGELDKMIVEGIVEK